MLDRRIQRRILRGKAPDHRLIGPHCLDQRAVVLAGNASGQALGQALRQVARQHPSQRDAGRRAPAAVDETDQAHGVSEDGPLRYCLSSRPIGAATTGIPRTMHRATATQAIVWEVVRTGPASLAAVLPGG